MTPRLKDRRRGVFTFVDTQREIRYNGPMVNEELLEKYLAGRERARWDEANEMFETLSERERALVRDAAIMGFVQGSMAAGGISRESFPKDRVILRDTLLGCSEHKDLYPTIGTIGDEQEG